MTDPRQARIVFAKTKDGGQAALTIQHGGLDAPLNRSLRDVGASLSAAVERIRDIDASPILASEAQRMRAEAAGKAAGSVTALAAVLQDTRSRVENLLHTASYVKPTSDATPVHVVVTDIALAQRLAAMPDGERAQLMQKAAADPATHLRWIEAALRTPTELSGVRHEQRDAARVAALRVFAPDEYAMVANEARQWQAARDGLQAAVGVLRGAHAEAVAGVMRNELVTAASAPLAGPMPLFDDAPESVS